MKTTDVNMTTRPQDVKTTGTTRSELLLGYSAKFNDGVPRTLAGTEGILVHPEPQQSQKELRQIIGDAQNGRKRRLDAN